jgi:hypothetical protein
LIPVAFGDQSMMLPVTAVELSGAADVDDGGRGLRWLPPEMADTL